MADLGAIGSSLSGLGSGVYSPNRAKRVAIWAIDDLRSPITIPTKGFYAGVVADNYPTPMPNALVRLYYLPTGTMIAQQFTGADGSFHFDFIEPGKSWYYIVAFDALGWPTNYRAKVYDQVVAGT